MCSPYLYTITTTFSRIFTTYPGYSPLTPLTPEIQPRPRIFTFSPDILEIILKSSFRALTNKKDGEGLTALHWFVSGYERVPWYEGMLGYEGVPGYERVPGYEGVPGYDGFRGTRIQEEKDEGTRILPLLPMCLFTLPSSL